MDIETEALALLADLHKVLMIQPNLEHQNAALESFFSKRLARYTDKELVHILIQALAIESITLIQQTKDK